MAKTTSVLSVREMYKVGDVFLFSLSDGRAVTVTERNMSLGRAEARQMARTAERVLPGARSFIARIARHAASLAHAVDVHTLLMAAIFRPDSLHEAEGVRVYSGDAEAVAKAIDRDLRAAGVLPREWHQTKQTQLAHGELNG